MTALKNMTKNALIRMVQHAHDDLVKIGDKNNQLVLERDNMRRENQRLYEEVKFLKPIVNKLVRQ